MPMPPPRASTSPPLSRRRRRELAQIERALRDRGQSKIEDLAAAVGASYWDAGRFDRALAAGISAGLVRRNDTGQYSTAG